MWGYGPIFLAQNKLEADYYEHGNEDMGPTKRGDFLH
jgi:hypothetical protein